MRLNGLRAFRYIYESGSISAASERLNLSQPAVSRLLSSLEELIEIKLFFRRGRRLTPTPEGDKFYAQTHRLLASIDDLPRIARDIRDGSKQRVRLLTMPRLATEVALPIVAQLHKKLSKLEIQIDIVPRRDLEPQLNRLDYEIAIATLPISGNVADIEPVSVQRLYAVVPREHPLAECRQIEVRQMAGHEMVALPTHTRHRQDMDDIFRSFSTNAKIVVTVSTIEAAVDLVSRGVGMTLADGIMRRIALKSGCVMIPLVPTRSVTYAIIRPPIRSVSSGLIELEDALKARFLELPEQG